VAKLSATQAKIVKGKVQGKTGRQIGLEVYPNAKPESSSVLVSRELNKVNVQEALQSEFEKQGITIEAIVRPIKDGLTASKTVIIGKEEDAFADEVPDHSIRLKASGMAAQFLGIGKTQAEGGIHFHQHIESQKDKYGI